MTEETQQPESPPEQPESPPEPPASLAPTPETTSDATSEVTADDRNLAMLCHLLAFAGYIVPCGNVAGPLILWLMKKDGSAFLDDHGKEVINFQLSLLIWTAIGGLLLFVMVGFIVLPILALVQVICTILGAVKAQNGEMYEYPITIRFLK